MRIESYAPSNRDMEGRKAGIRWARYTKPAKDGGDVLVSSDTIGPWGLLSSLSGLGDVVRRLQFGRHVSVWQGGVVRRRSCDLVYGYL
jgi:hypothetical protein